MRSRKRTRRWWIIAGILTALAVIPPALAGLRPVAAAADGAITLSDSQTGLCLDSNYANPADPANGAVYTDPCNGGTYQQWSASAVPGGASPNWTLTDQQTGLCLESNSAGAVFTEGCTGGTAQEWAIDGAPNGDTGFCDVYTGMCLDSSYAGSVYTGPGNGDTYQSWIIQGMRTEVAMSGQ